jgi:hypothetical protein
MELRADNRQVADCSGGAGMMLGRSAKTLFPVVARTENMFCDIIKRIVGT